MLGLRIKIKRMKAILKFFIRLPQNQKQIKNESEYAVIKQMSHHFSKKGRWFFYKDYLKHVQSSKKLAVLTVSYQEKQSNKQDE